MEVIIMTNREKTAEDERDIDAEYRADHADDLTYEAIMAAREQEKKAVNDPYDLLEQYPHAEDCADFAELIPYGEIGSATGDWGFCPFCGDYI
jgi:hypothetical protein